MGAFFAVVLIVVAFLVGLVVEPYVAMSYADQLTRARDTIGMCGGSTVCGEPYALPPEPSPPPSADEPPPATTP